jgi:type II secretion system protein C
VGPLPGTATSIAKQPQPLLLIATHRGSTPATGTASIGTQASNPQTYAAGALLVNGARLVEIHEEFVVLERGGQQAKLYLANRGQTQKSALLTVGGESTRPQLMAAQHTDVLVQYLRPSPVYEGEVLKGYQVYPGPRSDLFARLGLRSGDVILALEGVPFADPQQAIAALEQLTLGRSLLATLERGGQVEQVTLEGGVILAEQGRASLP